MLHLPFSSEAIAQWRGISRSEAHKRRQTPRNKTRPLSEQHRAIGEALAGYMLEHCLCEWDLSEQLGWTPKKINSVCQGTCLLELTDLYQLHRLNIVGNLFGEQHA